jgi:exosortase A-associated hydrolase 1
VKTSERPLVFECDGDALIGVLSAPAQPLKPLGVLIVVGGPQYRVGSHRQFVVIARQLAAAGYAVLRFDYRGMGDSAATPRAFDDVDRDIKAALDAFAAAEPGLQGFALWGLCDAASACLIYGASDARVRRMILVNPWVRTQAGEAQAYLHHYYLRRMLQASFWRKLLSGQLRVGKSLADLSATVKQSRESTPAPAAFIERMRAGLARFDERVLFLISGRDLTAKEFEDLCAGDRDWRRLRARATSKTIELGTADHTFSTRADLDAASARCVEWLNGA